MLLLGPTRLLTFKDFFSNVDFFLFLECSTHVDSAFNCETEYKIGQSETNEYFDIKEYYFKIFFHPYTFICPTRLLNFKQFSTIHVYLPLHVYSGRESTSNSKSKRT